MFKFLHKFLILSIFTALLVLSPTQAQEVIRPPAYEAGPWVYLGGPWGGMGYDIRVHPDKPNVYFVTDAFNGIFRSEDYGMTWKQSVAGITERGGASGDVVMIFCTTIDPNNPDVVWLGMQDVGAVYRSEDNGLTWEKRSNGFNETYGFTVRGIGVDPNNSDVVYAAGEIASWVYNGGANNWGQNFDRVMGVVYKSTDAGMNWTEIWRGDNLARYVLIDPTDSNTLYVSTGLFDREAKNSQAPDTPGGVGILKSTDGGQTWQQINNGLNNLYIGTLAMHPSNPQILIAGAGNNTFYDGGGAYITRDGGENWEYLIGYHISAVEFSTSDPNVIYIAGIDEFYRTTNGGARWTSFQDAEGHWGPNRAWLGFPIDMQSDPTNRLRLFVNSYGGGNFLTEDGGETWVNASQGYTGADINGIAVNQNNPAIVYVNGRSAPFRSIDGGVTWESIDLGGTELRRVVEGQSIFIDPSNDQHIIMSAAISQAFESFDGGDTFSMVMDYFEANNGRHQTMSTLAFAPSNPKRVYQGWAYIACISSLGEICNSSNYLYTLLVSDDGGTTWHEPVADDSAPQVEIRTVVSSGTVNLRGGAGTNFEIVGTLNPNDSFEVVKLEGEWYEIKYNDATAWIYAPLTASSSGGTSGLALEPSAISKIIVHPEDENTLWVAQVSKGIFKSTDGGVSWKKLTDGSFTFMMDLAIDPSNLDVMYTGTVGLGVYKTTDGGRTWQQMNAGMNANEAVVSIVIDPVRPNIVYAATINSGVYVSEDSGESWRTINDGLLSRWSKVLGISSDGSILYYGTRGGGVFRLGDLP